MGPVRGRQDRQDFIDWLNNFYIHDDVNWMIIGDCNFYRSLEDRNREGGNMQDVMIFNEVISNLGLQEIPLKGRNYTWSNMQQGPLSEQIDWCFTLVNWISDFPNTLLLPMAWTTSDHIPFMVQIGTTIPKAKLFKFENLWVDQPGFLNTVQSIWAVDVRATNSGTNLTTKFKMLRTVLKRWALGLSKIKTQIKQCNEILLVMDKKKKIELPTTQSRIS
jgi:hypothetical protein